MNDFWTDIYGQETIKEILTQLIVSSKIPHALLFTGIEGIGKDFTALKFAQTINTKLLDNVKSSEINKQLSNYSEPYIKYIFPLPRGKNETDSSGPTEKLSLEEVQSIQEEIKKKSVNPYYKISIPKASNIKISSIRDIKKFLSFEFSDVLYRIILISDAHLMNDTSQNALLKSLEEPPPGIIFILTTPYPALLRGTIRSRCWEINFKPLSNNDVKNILVKYFGIDLTSAEKIAVFSGGSIFNSMNLIEHNFEELLEKTIHILRYSFGRKYNSALDQFNPYLKENSTDAIKLIINMINIWLSDLQRFRFELNDYYYSEYKETLEKFNARFPYIQLKEIVSKFENLSTLINNNVNINLIILNIIYELSALTTPHN
ncbi:MAG: hypothetical protein M1480_09010 [Bacteroidetes bacterium]|nr:hypothetical protein [Bacteroidota bacterium]